MQYKRAMANARVMEEQYKPRLYLDAGTVFGEKYIIVHPYLYNWLDMEIWCLTQFGPVPKDGVWTPGARWYMNNQKFWFRNDADLSWFLLRWS